MRTITIGLFPNITRAEEAIKELKDLGVPDEDISFIYKDATGTVESDNSVGEGTMKGAAGGAAIGAIAGLIVANGILPGLGTLFVAGPLATALGLTGAAATTVAGATTGAVAGGLIGGLVSLGVDKEDATLYEERVSKGEILVVSKSEIPNTSQVFTKNSAMEIKEYIES